MGKTKQAKQKRSRQTFHEIIEATERLLAERLFDEVSVAEIVREAKSTVGSFYNLFEDKNALLPHLYERHCRELLVEYESICSKIQKKERSLHEVVSLIVKAIVELHQNRKGLLRALVLRSHLKATPPTATRNDISNVLPGLAKLVASRSGEINHPRPVVASKLGLMAVLATIREIMLYPNTSANSLGIAPRNLTTELTRLWLSYLDTQY